MGAAAIIPAIIGAGGAIAGGLLGGKGNKEQRAAAKAQADTLQYLLGLGKQISPVGVDFLQRGGAAYAPVLDFYKTLLTGNRTALAQLLGPEIQNIGKQYSTAFNTSAELNPRSGAGATMRAELPFSQARDIGNLFMQVRPMAAQNLFAVGSDFGRLGLGTIGAAFGGGGAAGTSAANLGALGGQLFGQGASTGAGLGAIFQQAVSGIDWSKVFNKSSSGSGYNPLNIPPTAAPVS